MKIAEPAWSEAMGHGEDQSGSRQDRTRGRRRTRMEPGRKGPEGMQGKAEGAQESRQQQQQLSTSVHQMEPEAQGRVAASRHR